MATASPPLHTCTVQSGLSAANRVHMFLHGAAILILIYYRAAGLLSGAVASPAGWAFASAAELIFAFIWLLSQAFRWRLVTRTGRPEALDDCGGGALPRVDVFVPTADPGKEPTVEVMNTVISAMALDYPPEKLAVYLSDDGGAAVTLRGMREARRFARRWLPFCRKYGIKTRCPEAYFSTLGDDERLVRSEEFTADDKEIKLRYEEFKTDVEKKVTGESDFVVHDRPAHVEIIREDGETQEDQVELPLLVYVSREKRPNYPHRFKAGALNALLRVSGIISNGQYILVLDCDMYCNDPTSARQAMCFHLDPNKSPSLAFVQYPQIFYNVSKNDIYDGQARSAYKTKWQGMDGLRGPVLTGTGYYMRRKALFGSPNNEDEYLGQPENNFGYSEKFIASLRANNQNDVVLVRKSQEEERTIREAEYLASCALEKKTKWGTEIGFLYECLLESTFTGYYQQCKGWTSVYLYPERPCFLGCTTIDMKDALVQLMKWSSGLFGVACSRFCPLTYAMSRMSILQTMCYAYFTFSPLLSVAMLFYGIAPQLCLLKGIPLFPKVTDPWFAVFAFLYLSSLLQHLCEVMSSDGGLKTWWNEQRIWVIKTVTACLFGLVDFLLKRVGIQKAKFRLTNKAVDKEKLQRYEEGRFDLEGTAAFMVPLMLLVFFNIACFVAGVRRVAAEGNWEEMFVQLYQSAVLLVMSYPILEGMVMRKRN